MIAERLLDLRNKKGLSQNELAKRLGIARTTYAGYENGSREPDIEMINKLADFHGVKVSQLIEDNKKESAEAPSKSKLDLAVERIEEDLKVTLKDDPIIMEALENYLYRLGSNKKKNQTD